MKLNLINKIRSVGQKFGNDAVKQWFWNRDYAPNGRYAHCYGETEWPELYAIIADHARGGRILDMGCGTGGTARELPVCYSRYVGVDVSQVAIDFAIKNGNPNQSFVRSDFLSYKPTGSFNVIIFRESIYFAPDPVAFLVKLSIALTAGGVFVIVLTANGSAKHFRQISKSIEDRYPGPKVDKREGSGYGTDWIIQVIGK